jgi:predicted RNA-binding protein
VEVIEVKNGRLRVINIFGEEKEIKGAFKRFSLRENKIVFQAT